MQILTRHVSYEDAKCSYQCSYQLGSPRPWTFSTWAWHSSSPRPWRNLPGARCRAYSNVGNVIILGRLAAPPNLWKELRALRHWTNLMSTMRSVMEWGACPSTRPSCTLDELRVVVPSLEPSKGHSIRTPNPSLPYAGSLVDWHNTERL